MCQALRVRPRKIGNTQCRTNHLATKAMALSPGTFRPSILFLIIAFIGSSYRIIFKNVSHLTKYLLSLRPIAPSIRQWQYFSKIAIIAWKPWTFPRTTKLQPPGHFCPAGHGSHTPVLRIWINEYRFPHLKVAARELGIRSTSAPPEQVFGVAATMQRWPESTKARVEPTTLGVTAIEIQLDRVNSTMGVTTSSLYVA